VDGTTAVVTYSTLTGSDWSVSLTLDGDSVLVYGFLSVTDISNHGFTIHAETPNLAPIGVNTKIDWIVIPTRP
jgi:hypothetical protein